MILTIFLFQLTRSNKNSLSIHSPTPTTFLAFIVTCVIDIFVVWWDYYSSALSRRISLLLMFLVMTFSISVLPFVDFFTHFSMIHRQNWWKPNFSPARHLVLSTSRFLPYRAISDFLWLDWGWTVSFDIFLRLVKADCILSYLYLWIRTN